MSHQPFCLDNLKDIEKLLKLCRKQGVTECTVGNMAFKLGDLPERQAQIAQDEEPTEPYANFPDGPLSQEELTFFANGGLPEDNPYRQEQ